MYRLRAKLKSLSTVLLQVGGQLTTLQAQHPDADLDKATNDLADIAAVLSSAASKLKPQTPKKETPTP